MVKHLDSKPVLSILPACCCSLAGKWKGVNEISKFEMGSRRPDKSASWGSGARIRVLSSSYGVRPGHIAHKGGNPKPKSSE